MLRQGSLAALLLGLSLGGQAQPAPGASLPPYQDKIIEGLIGADDPEDAAQRAYDASGSLRSYSLEGLSDLRQAQSVTTRSLGLRASGFIDTQNYGSLSGNLTWQGGSNAMGAATSYVVRQVGMPFEGGWRADNALGMINLPTLELARKSPRVTLTGPAMQGLSSHWLQNGSRGLLVSAGQPGRFEGFPVPGFSVTQGSYGLLGGHDQWRAAGAAWQWGGMLAQARSVPSVLAATSNGQGIVNAQGLYLAARREDLASGSFWQANLASGSNTGADFRGQANPPAHGVWIDGGFSSGADLHSWGLLRLDAGLSWLDLPLVNDLQGGYWRFARRTRQWSAEAGLDLLAPVSGTTPSGFFATNSLRYQYTSGMSFGGSISLRRYGVQAQSLLLYTQFANDWGSTRAQLEWGSADTGDRQLRLQLDHDWTFVESFRISTSASLDNEQKPGVDLSVGRGVAVNADWDLGRNLSLKNSLQGRWATDQTQYNFTFGLNWRLAPQWSLLSNIYATQGSNNLTAIAQSPLTPIATTVQALNDRGIFITLRYDATAGRASAPLGGAPGSAAGRLMGTVYLDENKNSKRDASERGAASVTVLLDGRFATQTDAQGRFEFPYVTAGAHVLTVSSDNLPLPWSLEKEGRTELRIFTRDTTTVDIGAVKP